MLSRKKSRFRKQAGTYSKRLRFEALEPRCLLTAATLVEPQQFRADNFSIGGSFTYDMRLPNSNNYHDWVENGVYSSTAGHVAWTSPKAGTGFMEASATGPGRSTFDAIGSTWTATTYTIDETGRFDFSIDAALAKLQMVTVNAYTAQYQSGSYQNPRPLGSSGPDFPQPAQAPAHFFGGAAALYLGTFDPSTQKALIGYSQSSLPPDPPMTATAGSPAAALVWADNTATDMVLTIKNIASPISVPASWSTVSPTSQLAAGVDLAQGLEFTVDVHGKPVPTTKEKVETPVATVKLFWAASATDMTGQEIPVTADTGTLGVYWNSSHLHSLITGFPARPANASFVRVTITAAPGVGTIASNSTQFVAIFQARSDTNGPVSANSAFDGRATSLLAAADRLEPDIKVEAYAPTSSRGAVVQVVNQQGGYWYNPTAAPQIQALAQGETTSDVIQFLAVKAQAGSLASHTITVVGVNDAPVAGTDTSATKSYRKLLLTAETLLANDTDVDHNDVITLSGVASKSSRGADVLAILANSKIVQIEYNPMGSSELKSLAPGQQLSDDFTYEISDLLGAKATGHVVITVTGSQLLTIRSVPAQGTRSDRPTAAIPLTVVDPDADASNLQWSGQAANPSLIPNANLQFSGTGQQWQLVINPVSGNTGRTPIQLTVSDGLGRSTSASFLMVVGSAEDWDLDGVPNTVEDAGPNGGDMNADGIPDSRQPNVASLPAQGSGVYLCLIVPGTQGFSQVASVASPAPSGSAANAQFPLGLVQYELLVENPGAASTVTFRTNLATPTLNRFYQYDAPPGVGWRTFMDNGNEGARVFADRIEVNVRDGGRGDQGGVPSDGQIIAVGAPAHVAHPWQNDQPLDVNNDGVISPLDVLTLIIQINLNRPASLGELPQGTDSLPPFLDPSGDNLLSSLDVLTVINYLNNAAGGEGEANAPAAAVATPVPNATVELVLVTQTLDTAYRQGDSGLSRSPESLVGPAVVQSVAIRAPIAKRKADFASDVDSLLAELGRLTEI